MGFDTTAYLRKATSRAKSDVANKLVSMFLHDVSRKISVFLSLNVADPRYANAVVIKFGTTCCYCSRQLESDRASIEHLDGMNRFRAGLHIPGNVCVACKKCNNEKRRDDQLQQLTLAKSGWESFLSHDSTKCAETCKTCQYWKSVWPDQDQKSRNLNNALKRIYEFRSEYNQAIQIGLKAQSSLHQELERLYRECQSFATSHIKGSVDIVITNLDLRH